MSAIDEVKQKIDIVEVISQYASLKKAGRNFTALCPFHSETRPSFFVYPERQSWHCFGACNTGGDVFSFVMKKENLDFGEALRLLAERAGVTIPSRLEPDTRKDEKERLHQINEVAARYFHHALINSPAGEKARSYLDNRSISPKTTSDFQLGFSLNSWELLKQHLVERGYSETEQLEAGLLVAMDDRKTHDRFRNRLMFTIKDIRGRVIGFGARALDDSLPKYLNSPQTPLFDKSGSLYGLNLASAAIRQQDRAVIVEGYMDVITAHQNGFTNVVAAMGTSVTEKQVSTLKKLTKNIMLALDADAAGEEAMLRCLDYENSLSAEVKVIILPEGRDPDDVIKEDTKVWQYLLESALPVVDYTFNMVTAKLDLNTARDKSLVADSLFPVIDGIKDEIRRDHYMTRLSQLVKMSRRRLEDAFEEYRAKKKRKPTEKTLIPIRYKFVSSPLEEACLILLLEHPGLKDREERLLPEYFESSENREIFTAWQQAGNPSSLKDKLDTSIHEHFDFLTNKSLPSANIEQRYAEYARRLRERFFKNLEAKRAEVFSLEVELRGAGADLVKLEEEGIEPAMQLREIYSLRKQKR